MVVQVIVLALLHTVMHGPVYFQWQVSPFDLHERSALHDDEWNTHTIYVSHGTYATREMPGLGLIINSCLSLVLILLGFVTLHRAREVPLRLRGRWTPYILASNMVAFIVGVLLAVTMRGGARVCKCWHVPLPS